MAKLNLGCGPNLIPGWVNVDFSHADICIDLSDFPWQFASESIDEVLASHILEHFDRETGVRFLQECWRVMQTGALLHIAVPDMDKFIDCYNSGDFSPLGGYKWTDLVNLLGGDDTEQGRGQRHKYMYCWASLCWTLKQVGFTVKRRRQAVWFDTEDYEAISLYVEAIK